MRWFRRGTKEAPAVREAESIFIEKDNTLELRIPPEAVEVLADFLHAWRKTENDEDHNAVLEFNFREAIRQHNSQDEGDVSICVSENDILLFNRQLIALLGVREGIRSEFGYTPEKAPSVCAAIMILVESYLDAGGRKSDQVRYTWAAANVGMENF